jgi:hypothetical protein
MPLALGATWASEAQAPPVTTNKLKKGINFILIFEINIAYCHHYLLETVFDLAISSTEGKHEKPPKFMDDLFS